MEKQTETAGHQRPGKKAGQANEFTLIARLKPGGAARMREMMRDYTGAYGQSVDRIGSVHDLRYIIFDNDTRVIFASTFDGDWDQYINDFANIVPDLIDANFQECEGYPGVHSPEIKDWIVSVQVEAVGFYSGYPEVTVKEVKKGQRVLNAFEELLDTASV